MSSAPTERQLRSFCLLFSILFLCVAVFAASLRLLIGDGVPPVLFAQEILCAIGLIVMAALLLQVRSALRSPWVRQTGRVARAGTLVAGIVCALGLVVVLVSPLTTEAAAGKFPTVAVSVLTLVCVFFAYSGLAKLHR